jgi:hypothetical protein
VAIAARDADSGVVAHHLRSHHRKRLALRRVHLARHDAASGLVLGQAELAQTTTRARAEESDIVRNLHERDGEDVKSAVRLHQRIVGRERFELGTDARISSSLANSNASTPCSEQS